MSKHLMGTEERTAAMEKIFEAAFDHARGWKKDHGVKDKRDLKEAPKSYKVTIWLRPWQYMQACGNAARAGISLTKYLQESHTDPRLRDILPTRENQKKWREEERDAERATKQAKHDEVGALRTRRFARPKALLNPIRPDMVFGPTAARRRAHAR